MDKSNFITFMELKLMMEKLEEPQTHLALKEMIRTVDEDNDGQISFREVSQHPYPGRGTMLVMMGLLFL